MSQRGPNYHIDDTPAATVRSTKAADIPMYVPFYQYIIGLNM